MSQAAQDAAENLLDKAINGLLSGDSERAEKFIARAAAIPFDEHEQVWPGPMMADQMLHGFLSDFVEDWADAQEHPEDYELVMWLHDDIARVVDKLDSDEGRSEERRVGKERGCRREREYDERDGRE